MTAHVVFSAIDRRARPARRRRVTREVIRGEIGFDGLLMSDDLSMKALSGPMRARAEAVIAAGSDLALHCNGDWPRCRRRPTACRRSRAGARRFRTRLSRDATAAAVRRRRSRGCTRRASLALEAARSQLNQCRLSRQRAIGWRSASQAELDWMTVTNGHSSAIRRGARRWEAPALDDVPARGGRAHRRRRRLRGAARSAAGAGPHAEGRHRQDLHPGAGRPVSRLHRRGAEARLELAADYLVMAAWLAYLKSRLLLPRENEDPATSRRAEELAQRLAFRLMRLDAMRTAAAQLMTRKRLGRDVFPRGMPEGRQDHRARRHRPPRSTICSRPMPSSAAAPSRSPTSSRRARSGRSRMRASGSSGWSARRAGDWVQLDLFLEQLSAARRRRAHGARELVRRDARDGARRPGRAAAGRAVRADLHAQARAGRAPGSASVNRA